MYVSPDDEKYMMAYYENNSGPEHRVFMDWMETRKLQIDAMSTPIIAALVEALVELKQSRFHQREVDEIFYRLRLKGIDL